MGYLTRVARIPTTGARAVEPCEVDGQRYLVIPQLAVDVDGEPPGLDGGDSESAKVLVVRVGEDAGVVATLPVPGGEDAEFFTIGDRHFLAIASIRSGTGPYVLNQPQRIYEWTAGGIRLAFTIDGFAAKQWRHFRIGHRHFLALAQGVPAGGAQDSPRPSTIYEWNDARLELLQVVPSRWGYNWHHLSIEGTHYLAYADHLAPSVLMRWDGARFDVVQDLIASGGRAFADFDVNGEHYLLSACLTGSSRLWRWDGTGFVAQQDLAGTGGREFAVLRQGQDVFVVRVNFIIGGQRNPTAALNSQIYRFDSGQLHLAEEFATTGATDVASWQHGDDTFVAISSGLSADLRFASHTDIYRFSQESG